jgi:hypothetical protein
MAVYFPMCTNNTWLLHFESLLFNAADANSTTDRIPNIRESSCFEHVVYHNCNYTHREVSFNLTHLGCRKSHRDGCKMYGMNGQHHITKWAISLHQMSDITSPNERYHFTKWAISLHQMSDVTSPNERYHFTKWAISRHQMSDITSPNDDRSQQVYFSRRTVFSAVLRHQSYLEEDIRNYQNIPPFLVVTVHVCPKWSVVEK